MIKVALIGNPNCGKTTLFNALTGSTAHVGNWPGVTVDKKEGLYKKLGDDIQIIDLPGIYSLSPYTPEEVISRNYIIEEKPDCIIDVIDATNLERNLYLTTQLLEIDIPIVVALNMMDLVEKHGDKIDVDALKKALGVPVVAISALKTFNDEELMLEALNTKKRKGITVLENTRLKPLIDAVMKQLEPENLTDPLFHAIKLIEEDEIEIKEHNLAVGQVILFKEQTGIDTEATIADERYKYIENNYSVCVTKKEGGYVSKSEKIDRFVTHKIWGFPIFIFVMFLVFHLTFSENFLFLGGVIDDNWISFKGTIFEGVLGAGAINSPGVIITKFFSSLIDYVFGLIGGLFASSPMWLNSLINDGILAGLSAILGFIPLILILYLFLSILEDSGYMARVAFIFDRVFKKFGLSGRALMPMIMGFGCSVPAMANTRTLQNQNERTSTIRVIPFFSCGAKLPILTAISGAIVIHFGFGNADLITYSMYLIGIIVAIISVIIMRSTTMKGEQQPFIMELPTYHRPGAKSLALLIIDKAKHFLQKAFTIILASTIVVWFLMNFTFDWKFIPNHPDLDISRSILASLGMFIQPLFTPLGFGGQLGSWGWVFIVAAITGLIAKENVVATFGTLAGCFLGTKFTGTGAEAVIEMINATGITAAGLIAFIIFNMTTIPCMATVATAKAESPNRKTFRFTILFWIITSYITSTVIYLIGSYWWTSFIFASILAFVFVVIYLKNKKEMVK